MTEIKKYIENTKKIGENLNLKIYKTIGDILIKIELILDNRTIGEIYKTSFGNSKKTFTNNHLYLEIKDGYRKKGYGQKLFNSWLEEGGKMPELEYSSKISRISFLIKNGYKVIGFFKGEKFFCIKESEIKKIIENNKNYELEKQLSEVFLLKK